LWRILAQPTQARADAGALLAVFIVALFVPLAPAGSWIAGAIIAALAAKPVKNAERTGPHIRYATAFTVAVFCALLVLSLRPAFSACAAITVVIGLINLSKIKFKYLRMHLHAYDFIYYMRNSAAISFLLKHYRSLVTLFLWPVILSGASLAVIWIVEPEAVARSHAAIIFPIALIVLAIARHNIAPRRFMGHYLNSSMLTNFLETIFESIGAIRAGGVMAVETLVDDVPALPRSVGLEAPRHRPNIILILNESTFPPSLYPSIDYDPTLADFFRSIDGSMRRLRVETFGGGSWITEFSLLTGIPASSYGLFKPHVFHWAKDKIEHSLARCLKQYSYRTAAIYPLGKEFLNTGDFYLSIGFDEFIDQTMLSASRGRKPDVFYLNHTLDWLTRHFARCDEPAFVFTLTMANHYPHNGRFSEESGTFVHIAAEDNLEIKEYLRRLQLSAREYADFRMQLRNRFPDREFLIVHFGDHQPPLTSKEFGNQDWMENISWLPSNDVAYHTYFTIDGDNFKPRIDDDLPDAVEIAYLGTVILMAAGLPLDPVHSLRRELMLRHSGRLFFADDEGRIAAQLNRRLIDAGLIKPH
jgi:phosphoglycerol transferase MdoB-like AlkP superfamily enzyme